MGTSRNADILENMLGAYNDLPEPESEIERLLQLILQNSAITITGKLIIESAEGGTVTLNVG